MITIDLAAKLNKRQLVELGLESRGMGRFHCFWKRVQFLGIRGTENGSS